MNWLEEGFRTIVMAWAGEEAREIVAAHAPVLRPGDQECLDLTREREGQGIQAVVKGLDAEPNARQKQARVGAVMERERPHALEARHALRAPGLIPGHDAPG